MLLDLTYITATNWVKFTITNFFIWQMVYWIEILKDYFSKPNPWDFKRLCEIILTLLDFKRLFLKNPLQSGFWTHDINRFITQNFKDFKGLYKIERFLCGGWGLNPKLYIYALFLPTKLHLEGHKIKRFKRIV